MKNEDIILKFKKDIKKDCYIENCCRNPIVEIDVCLNKKHLKYYFCKKHLNKLEKEIIEGDVFHE